VESFDVTTPAPDCFINFQCCNGCYFMIINVASVKCVDVTVTDEDGNEEYVQVVLYEEYSARETIYGAYLLIKFIQ